MNLISEEDEPCIGGARLSEETLLRAPSPYLQEPRKDDGARNGWFDALVRLEKCAE